jgi:hypothetical protein
MWEDTAIRTDIEVCRPYMQEFLNIGAVEVIVWALA